MNRIATVINYCSIDNRFIDRNVEECLQFSELVYIVMCDHLLDGTPENLAFETEAFRRRWADNAKVELLIFPYPKKLIKEHGVRIGHNMCRYLGYSSIKDKELDYILFLDADEIPEGTKVRDYLKDNKLEADCIRFANYWYFREPTYQAQSLEDSITLVKLEAIKDDRAFFTEQERDMFPLLLKDSKRMELYKDKPLFHHFSWVRTKDQMLRKVGNWGHKNDKDWPSLVEEEFSRDFNGTDFVHNYNYNIVDNIFGI